METLDKRWLFYHVLSQRISGTFGAIPWEWPKTEQMDTFMKRLLVFRFYREKLCHDITVLIFPGFRFYRVHTWCTLQGFNSIEAKYVYSLCLQRKHADKYDKIWENKLKNEKYKKWYSAWASSSHSSGIRCRMNVSRAAHWTIYRSFWTKCCINCANENLAKGQITIESIPCKSIYSNIGYPHVKNHIISCARFAQGSIL